jgi:hypothetical protein
MILHKYRFLIFGTVSSLCFVCHLKDVHIESEVMGRLNRIQVRSAPRYRLLPRSQAGTHQHQYTPDRGMQDRLVILGRRSRCPWPIYHLACKVIWQVVMWLDILSLQCALSIALKTLTKYQYLDSPFDLQARPPTPVSHSMIDTESISAWSSPEGQL